jgi:hypothetical protein
VEAEEVDEVYQDDGLSCSFNIDVKVPEERKQALRKKKCNILSVLYISYYVLAI